METRQVTLDPGESQVVAFTYTPQQARTYYVAINGLSGSFEAIAGPPVFDPWDYDLNVSCYIETDEMQTAIDDWVSNIIDTHQLLQVINLWSEGTRNPAC